MLGRVSGLQGGMVPDALSSDYHRRHIPYPKRGSYYGRAGEEHLVWVRARGSFDCLRVHCKTSRQVVEADQRTA